MKIDAAVHFWKFEKATAPLRVRNSKILAQHYLPEQLSQTLGRNAIDGCIAVSIEDQELETRFLSELALTHPEIKGVVGWTRLDQEDSIDKLHELHDYISLKGFRIGPDENSRPGAAGMEVLKEYGYTLDMAMDGTRGLEPWILFTTSYPDQVFILENSANPATAGKPEKQWETSVRQLAGHPNIHAKVSGLLTGGIDPRSWKPADLYPYLDILFDAFGVERLLYASDWPFILGAGMYVQWKSLLEKYLENFLPEDQDKFFGENARSLYRL
jgi:L-fuconolactonase